MSGLKVDYTFRFNGLTWQSGYFYTFRYRAYQSDPIPLIILFYRITGINPSTGHQWRLIQGINMNYIPRSHRRLFLMQWQNYYETSRGNIKFTYEQMKRQYPYLRYGIRRYLTKPVYYIQKPYEIPMDKVEEAVLSTFDKDFSHKIKLELAKKYKEVSSNIKAHNRKVKKGLFGGGNLFRSLFNRFKKR
jgi:hypothetical protein